MHLIRGLQNISEEQRGCALTIGNFDGIHLGHQALLRELSSSASTDNSQTCLMTFHPLPSEYFDKHSAGARLMSTREKLYALRELPESIRPDYFLLLSFNKKLAEMTADEFIQKILVDKLAIKSLIVGDDFRFGKNRTGDFQLLAKAGERFGFTVSSLSTHHVDSLRVSSTRIRDALLENDFPAVEKMMGRPYTICGIITHGDKRGRLIGFPTANIALQRFKSPIHGVYSVTMHTEEFGDINGIANIGKRPTFNGIRNQLEVHLFDFDRDIYGLKVCVSFLKKIRGEQKFNSVDELQEQIERDCKIALDHFKNKP